MAKTLSQGELERAVTEANPDAHPRERVRPVTKDLSELKVTVDRETEENLAVLKELLSQKLGKAATLKDVVAWSAKVVRDKFDPVKKAEKKISLGNKKPQPPQRGRHALKASAKHEVIRSQGNQCAFTSPDGRRCEQKRWLQFHHVVPVANGGLNVASNLQRLCTAHHRFLHRE